MSTNTTTTQDGTTIFYMDIYADDLAIIIEPLDLHDVVLVGHSTGGGKDEFNANPLTCLQS